MFELGDSLERHRGNATSSLSIASLNAACTGLPRGGVDADRLCCGPRSGKVQDQWAQKGSTFTTVSEIPAGYTQVGWLRHQQGTQHTKEMGGAGLLILLHRLLNLAIMEAS
jgi:hypothetical protein